ncbi:type ISP restriction/modification enzyme [Actinomyces sp. 2119]|uniref:type ISP restriction/modification enzyme n=1 Tax=Actinomyces sp. 2119 TaxID=2321393 RepID=UPI002175AD48|nr:type ISP restriction/modification enzyme [Actinomyces sp. 2119]
MDNITDATLHAYREAYGPTVSKDDVFYYVYGLLHSPDYRSRYGADLKKSLPRIPLVASRADFITIATAGRGLADLHLDYETVEPWPLTLTVDGKEVPWAQRDRIAPALLHVTKMRYAKTRVDGKQADDKTTIVYNEHVTVSGIPEAAQDYLLGSRSGLDWLIDRYQAKSDKASGIVNDPNDWMAEGAGGGPTEPARPLYLLELIARVAAVSMRTQQIVSSLPPLDVRN